MSVNNKLQEGYSDDEDELSDDDDEMDMDAFEDVEEEEEKDSNAAKASPIPDVSTICTAGNPFTYYSEKGPRPPGLIRSATDPISRLNASKGTRFPNLPRSAGLQRQAYNALSKPLVDGSKNSTDAEWSERESAALPPPKRRKVSPDQSNGGRVETPVPESPGQFFQLQGMMLDDNDVTQISEILSRGVDRTKSIAEVYELEKSRSRKAFEAGVQRANRRAHEAEERHRQALHDHGDDIKFRESQWKETYEILRRDLEKERRQRLALEEARSRELGPATQTQGEHQGSQTGNADDRQNLIRNLEHQLLMQRQEISRMQGECQRGIFDGCQFLVDTRRDDLKTLEHLAAQFAKLRASIDPLSGDLDDMGMKSIKKHIQNILEESARTAKTLEETTKWQVKRNISVDSLFNSTVPRLGQWATYLSQPGGPPPHIPRPQEAMAPVQQPVPHLTHPHPLPNTLPTNANAFVTNGTSTAGHEAPPPHHYPPPPHSGPQGPQQGQPQLPQGPPPLPLQSAPPYPQSSSPHQQPPLIGPPQPQPPPPHSPSHPHPPPPPTPPQNQSQLSNQPVHGLPPSKPPPQSNIITLHYGEKP